MSSELPKKPEFLPQNGPDPADASPIMQDRPPRRFEDPREALEALARWDELEAAELAALQANPKHAERLKTLRSVEAWLGARGNQTRAENGPCPSAEQLYDYGRGPGAAPLATGVRNQLEQHIQHCPACERHVDSLAQRPPAVLVAQPLAAPRIPTPLRPHPPRPSPIEEIDEIQARRAPTWRRSLALAASLLGALTLWTMVQGQEDSALPQAPLLRGEDHAALWFPRGKVLADRTVLGAFALPLRFELPAQVDAQSYRIELWRHTGAAFDEGQRVAELSGTQTTLLLEDALLAGHYTARVFATRAGLERECGAHDFEVVQDANLQEELARLSSNSEPQATRERVRLLHQRGYWGDARELARTLPPDAERERYLAQPRGR